MGNDVIRSRSRVESLPLCFCAFCGYCFYVPNWLSRKIATKSTNGTEKNNRWARCRGLQNRTLVPRVSLLAAGVPGFSLLCFCAFCGYCIYVPNWLSRKIATKSTNGTKGKKGTKNHQESKTKGVVLYRELASFAAIQPFTG